MHLHDLPDRYAWLRSEPAPRMLREALALHGVLEAKGSPSNPEIMQWAQEVSRAPGMKWLGSWYSGDDVPWCGLFLGVVALRAGKTVRSGLLSARDWAKWGDAVSGPPKLGDVLVFWRGSIHGANGHVGIYAAEDDEAYHVLGGNQGDRVSIQRVAKARLLAARNFYHTRQPANCRQVFMGPDGPLSQNEA